MLENSQSVGATTTTFTTSSTAPNKVIPLLQQLGRAEDLTSSLAMRLEPIINHQLAQNSEAPKNPPSTVTQRLSFLGDALQYLLDNIEL